MFKWIMLFQVYRSFILSSRTTPQFITNNWFTFSSLARIFLTEENTKITSKSYFFLFFFYYSLFSFYFQNIWQHLIIPIGLSKLLCRLTRKIMFSEFIVVKKILNCTRKITDNILACFLVQTCSLTITKSNLAENSKLTLVSQICGSLWATFLSQKAKMRFLRNLVNWQVNF